MDAASLIYTCVEEIFSAVFMPTEVPKGVPLALTSKPGGGFTSIPSVILVPETVKLSVGEAVP